MAQQGKLRLYIECGQCNGTGCMPNPAYDEWEASELTRRRLDPVRYGTPEDMDWRKSGFWPDAPCDSCCGRGMVPFTGDLAELLAGG